MQLNYKQNKDLIDNDEQKIQIHYNFVQKRRKMSSQNLI